MKLLLPGLPCRLNSCKRRLDRAACRACRKRKHLMSMKTVHGVWSLYMVAVKTGSAAVRVSRSFWMERMRLLQSLAW